jgi:dihydrofolate reductase
VNVFIIAALTADGCIARDAQQSSIKWTSRDDYQFFQERTKKAGVLIMGSTTFETISRALPERKIYVLSRSKTYEQFGESVEATQLPPGELLNQLEGQGVTEVAICGGTSIYTQFMQAGLVDEMYLTIEPVVFGEGVRLFNQSLETKIQLKETISLSDQTVVMHYLVEKG